MVNLRRLFRPGPARLSGQALYEAATRQARQPEFYSALGAPDSVEGRFELYSLHVVLLLHRLKDQGDEAAETAQALFDAYLSALDDALREMGVGDLAVAKKMRRLGEAFYGRAKAYDDLLAKADRAELAALIERTVLADAPGYGGAKLVDYVLASAAGLAGQPLAAILEARPTWPAIPQ
jgi:cytochrome b pre-mRNA-processing protein 3